MIRNDINNRLVINHLTTCSVLLNESTVSKINSMAKRIHSHADLSIEHVLRICSDIAYACRHMRTMTNTANLQEMQTDTQTRICPASVLIRQARMWMKPLSKSFIEKKSFFGNYAIVIFLHFTQSDKCTKYIQL